MSKKIKFCENWIFEGKNVTLPHDAMLAAGRDAESEGGSAVGYFKGSRAIYEKKFIKPEHSHVSFWFEGVYRKARVYINEQEAGGCTYGYSSFEVCADKFLKEGENHIRVEADNTEQPNSRWYSGTGIYRPVWMLLNGEDYIEPVSIRIRTICTNPAVIQVVAVAHGGEIEIEIYDENQCVAKGVCGNIEIENAKLWSADHPHLYTCRLLLKKAGEVVDEEERTFGIRQLKADKNGFYVNDNQVLLRGGCIHHDNGILGACAYEEAEWRKVRMLKEAGFNAIRSAHNPCSRALLDACDHYGIYVMDESWDMWFQRKNTYDYALDFEKNYKYDLEDMVKKDYNHPSVILYSIGNEVSEPASEKGMALAGEMVEYLHELDDTRFVTGGYNLMLIGRAKKGMFQYSEEKPDTKPMNSSMMFNKMASMIGTGMNSASSSKEYDEMITPLMDQMDIAGYNYASGRYEPDYGLHPERLIIGTETFPQDIVKNWKMVKKLPTLIGDFMWTAWDYLGEAGIGAWAYTKDGRCFTKPYPWLLGDVGVIDILGNPNGELYLAQAAWEQLKIPKICVQPCNHPGIKPAKQTWRGTNAIPSWSWKNCDGNKALVEVYSNAYEIELLLGGKRIGKRKVRDCVASFKVKYRPGVLEAVAFDADKNEIGRDCLQSADDASINVFFEQSEAKPKEILYVPINLADNNGVVESADERQLTVRVENGELLGLGSANPRTEDNYLSNRTSTYYGHALAVIRVGEQGQVKVYVSDGKEEAVASVLIRNRGESEKIEVY